MSATDRLIAGRYRLGELLGTGGSASAFEAVDERTGDPIALKILHPFLAGRAAARDAFVAEARRMRPLRHPNIAAVLDAGMDPGDAGAPVVWIALERAPGTTLAERVGRYGPLTPRDALAVADGVLAALEAAHGAGLIHRDVSPSNVMVATGSSGELAASGVRLLDFGTADATGRAALGTDELLSRAAQGRHGVIGNVDYMSPEQVRGMPVDERGDVYQVGAVLHFALTGRPPFPRASAGQVMRAHLESPPPPPSAVDPRVPRAVDRIVVRAMLKSPGDRFPSATRMRAVVTAAAVTTARGPAAVTAVVLAPSVPDSAEPGVTRVLARTVVPPRDPGRDPPPGAATARRATRARRGAAGRVGFGLAAVTVAGVVILLAATSDPTASVGTAPTPTAPPPVAVVQPEPFGETIPPVAVPALGGLSLAEAITALERAGLGLGDVTLVDSPYPVDTVLESDPAAGRPVAAGRTVALSVASGMNAVPDVVGRDASAATATVLAAGFVPSFASRPGSSGTARDVIVGSSPGAGERAAVGGTVTILVGPPIDPDPTPTVTASPTSTAPPTPTPDPGG